MGSQYPALRIVGSFLRWSIFAVGAVSAVAAVGVFAQTPQSTRSQSPAQVQPSPATLSDQDRTFIEKAAKDSMMQVELGELAAEHARSPRTRQLGLQSVESFSRAAGMLDAIASRMGEPLPQAPAPDARKLAQALAADPATVVDEEYLAQVVPASTVAVNLFKSEAENGENPALKRFATHMLPKLQQQRNLAVQLSENPDIRQAMRNRAFPPQPPGKPR